MSLVVRIMTEFVGLRAKLYSYKMLDNKETKKCKGIKKSVVDKKYHLKTIRSAY